MTNSVTELEDSDCILVTGSNTTEAHPLVATRIMRAVDKGAKLILVDPRAIQLAEIASIHLRQRPGTDVAWLNGMMHVILQEGLEDKEFISERTEGLEEFKTGLEEYTPAKVAEITGIAEDDLVRAAKAYASAESAAIVYAMGITQHTTGVDNVLSCANLAMLTGNVGRPSTGVNPLRGQNNVQGACDLGGLPNVYPGYQPVVSEAVQDKFSQAWGSTSHTNVGKTVTEMIEAAGNGELKALFVLGENPMVSDADINHVRSCLEKTEFLVVQDIFASETAELAHVILPGSSFAERDGTFTGTDRRVQLVRKAIEPLADSKADWEIIQDLARLMLSSETPSVAEYSGWDYDHPAEIMDEIAALTPIYGGVSHARLEAGDVLQWPVPTAEHQGTGYLHKGKFSRGVGRFHVVPFKEARELPDPDYPLVLTTGRMMFHFHTGTMTRRSEKLHQEVPEAYVEINPFDAEAAGIGNSELVRVSSRRGEIEARSWVTKRVPQGVIFIPFHFAEAAANELTIAALDPVAKIPEYKVCAVRVEKR